MPVSIPQLPSCVSTKDPFIKLGGGVAPSLNYNLPQKTSFTAYGDIGIPVDPSWFTAVAKQSPILLTFDNAKQSILNIVLYPDQDIPPVLQVLSPTNIATLKQYYAQALSQNSIVNIVDFVVNHGSDTTNYGVTVDYTIVLNNYINYLATLNVNANNAAISVPTFGNYGSNIVVGPRPVIPQPALFIIEEYKISSFLGDYGAGQTLNTFSLLPGEKHTITIKTFKSITATETRSDNVMDSFSQASAADFENSLDDESQSSSLDTTTKEREISTKVSLGFKLFGFRSGVDIDAGAKTASTASRTSNTNSISKALQKHTDNTNSNRTISVNSTTTVTSTDTNEEDTVREIVNPNLSRVLNFVFRQLLQQYITITYLNDIKIAFTNGNPESYQVASIEELDNVLAAFIQPGNQAVVKQMIWNQYHSVENYKGDMQNFLEEATTTDWDGATQKKYFLKKKVITGNYTYNGADGPKQITVAGPILNVDLNTLRTDSLVVDALLGQGEALDCFNSHAQNAKTQALYIDNDRVQLEQTKMQLILDTLNNIEDPVERAKQIAAIFNPQVENIIH